MFTALPPLSLYVHLPWCVRKCPYCDFNSHEARAGIPEDAYIEALLRDLDTEAAHAQGRALQSVFLGGGTPSLFSPPAIARLLEGIAARLSLPAGAEITLEANPGTVDTGRFREFRASGITRLSIGIQSFGDEQLRALGRIHGRAEALAGAQAARAAGFDNFNLDLMFGLPGQSPALALADVREALAFAPPHLSVYQLTLEPNTLFHARPPALPDEDSVAGMQEAIEAELASAGFDHYEVSAYAQPGATCRHNLNYWQFGDYLAVGAGAHGKLTAADGVVRRWKIKHPQDYLRAAGSPAATGGESRPRDDELAFEFLLNALRLRAGFTPALFEARTGLPFAAIAPGVEHAQARGWLEHDKHAIRPSADGRRYLNDVLLLFLPAARA